MFLITLFSNTISANENSVNEANTDSISYLQQSLVATSISKGNKVTPQLNTGAATYLIPISYPQARGKTQPSVNINYNSMRRNSIMGVGWNLELTHIEYESSEITQSIVYNLYISGSKKRLKSINEANTKFRALVEDNYLLIEKAGDSFIAKDGMGNKYIFNYKDKSESGVITKWYLSQSIDSSDNKVYYTYYQPFVNYSIKHKVLLNTISYNSTEGSSYGSSSHIQIKFEYSQRDNSYYQGGSGSINYNGKLLSKIIILLGEFENLGYTYNSNIIRSYKFNYIQSRSTGRSLLNEVTLYGKNEQDSLPPTKFKYTENINIFESNSNFIDFNWITKSHHKDLSFNGRLIDWNGDGYIDLAKDGVVYKNWNGAFEYTEAEPYYENQGNYQKVSDIDKDGLPDFIKIIGPEKNCTINFNNGPGFEYSQTQSIQC